jgi:LysR family transcriptional regulator, low CO2-responsive transcriptional regulator
MRLDQLVTFRCVADERSYTRAAERLFITPSAVYQQVRQLEHQVGMRLCYVVGKEVLLTPAGRAVHDFALCVGQRHEELIGQLKQLQDAGGRVVRIASMGYFGRLPLLAEQMAAKHPDITVEFRSLKPPDVVEMLRSGELDFGFFGKSYVPADLEAEPFTEQRIVVAVPTTHELAQREVTCFSDIQDAAFVGYFGGSARAAVDGWRQARPETEIRYAAVGDTSVSIAAMAQSMHLPAIVAVAAILDEVKQGRMRILPLADFNVSYTLYIVHRDRELLSPAAQAYLAEALGGARRKVNRPPAPADEQLAASAG